MAQIYMSGNEALKRQKKQKAKGTPKLVGEKPVKLVKSAPKVTAKKKK